MIRSLETIKRKEYFCWHMVINMDVKAIEVTNLKYYEVTQNNPIIIKLKTCIRKTLYHYTTKIGAKGILENNILWVTHSNFLDETP